MQQNRKVVEPGNIALEFYSINQKNSHGYVVFPDVVQEDILNILAPLSRRSHPPMTIKLAAQIQPILRLRTRASSGSF